MKLAYRVRDVFAVNEATDPPEFRSSLARAVRADHAPAKATVSMKERAAELLAGDDGSVNLHFLQDVDRDVFGQSAVEIVEVAD